MSISSYRDSSFISNSSEHKEISEGKCCQNDDEHNAFYQATGHLFYDIESYYD